MKCAKFKKYMIPYAEGTLSERQSSLMEEHLASCQSCSREFSEIAETIDVLRATDYPSLEPAVNMRGRVMSQIAQEPAPSSWWARKLPAYSAAAAGILFFGILLTTVKPAFFDRSPESPRATIPQTTPETHEQTSASAKIRGDAEMTDEASKPPRPADAERNRAHAEKRGGRSLTMTTKRPTDSVRSMRDSSASRKPTRYAASDRYDSVLATKSGEADKDSSILETVQPEAARGGYARPSGPPAPDADSPVPEGHSKAVSQAGHGGFQIQVQSPSEREMTAVMDNMPAMGNAPATPKASAERMAEDRALGLEKKLKEFPNSRTVLLELLDAYRDAGRSQDEYSIATRLTKLDPENAEYWFARGQAAERANMPRTAVASYRRAIELKLSGPKLDLAKSRLEILERRDQ